jgi:hypothetical protein
MEETALFTAQFLLMTNRQNLRRQNQRQVSGFSQSKRNRLERVFQTGLTEHVVVQNLVTGAFELTVVGSIDF